MTDHLEIERKFLVEDDEMLEEFLSLPPDRIEQFYLSLDPARAVRVRIARHADDSSSAKLTIKGERRNGVCLEIETPLALDQAQALRALAIGQTLIKTRRRVALADGLIAELDIYEAPQRVVLVEVELPVRDHPFAPPVWFGREVTQDARFFALSLASCPT